MLIVNTDTIPGMHIKQTLGVVTGNTIRAKHVGRDIMAGFKQLVGGELKGYTEMMEDSRNQALERLIAKATEMGANAVVNLRFSTSQVMPQAAEVLAYGTAVIVE
ncbi:MAG: YbjQ family protein [Planctomycetes bacterium]|nr:YbjQ family protein [Planctomycetota bacterium]